MPFQRGNKLGARRGRASVGKRTSTSRVAYDPSDDEEMMDGDVDRDDAPQDDEVDDEATSPAQDDVDDDDEVDEDEDDDGADSPPTITAIPRRRRGRGGRSLSSRRKLADGDDGSESGTPFKRRRGRGGVSLSSRMSLNAADGDEGSDSGTPLKRRRGRPPGSGAGRGRGGFRGRRKGAAPEAPRVVDGFGNVLEVVDDEALVDDDDDGNNKVDAKGHLQGGRQYRVRTFTVIGKDERLYMLSTEPARCCGFRDSYLFFTKHPKLYKVLLTETEKKDLIDREILPSSYKGRNIGVVTARSVFREFGARIIVAGRRVTDDYKEAEARANGEVEGELADPDDRIPDNNEDYDRNRYVAWFGASDVYRTAGPVGGVPGNKPGLTSGKRRNNITLHNWQFMHAKEASRFNSSLTALRRANLDGVYDANTNMMLYPKITQPTHARWEHLPTPETSTSPETQSSRITNGTAAINGDTHHEPTQQPITPTDHPSSPTLFPRIPPLIARNFAIIDTVLESPPLSHPGYPGPDGAWTDPSAGTPGLAAISPEIAAALPPSCSTAFRAARAAQAAWKARWDTEARGAARAPLRVGFNGYPV